ncbi:MAG: B12-binding domain-containing radical SAM protein [Candidatus Gastranaerophilales bacterium]|nr:B12-binding domain-containing radical SAM protein [Candidatus Gastranaerophilales bacterium]
MNCNLVMAYPAIEEFALSSLGYMWLCKIASEIANVERVSTDAASFNIKTTDAVAFSLSFDFDFMGVFEILEKNNIPFLASERDDNLPLIFAGGPVITTNPEPLKKVFDFMIIGDGEGVNTDVIKVLSKGLNKQETLSELAKIEGVYVPGVNNKVRKVTETLNNVIYTTELSEKSYFKDTFIIEVARGCMNRCAFCTASYINLPFRHYEYEKIIDAIELGLSQTNKIALLGAQISAHPKFDNIMKYLCDKMDSGVNIELGISSLRTDSVTPELVQTLVKGGQKTSTIAIEAASERLRRFINKNLKEEQILNAVKVARENGLRGLKIYSMIGIPTETQEDIEEFLRLAKIIKTENKGFEITFSFSTFVPKPQTPLQWAKREDTKSLEKKQKYLEKEFAKLGIGSKFSSAKWDYWQTVLSRGDENLTPFLIEIYKQGGKLGAYKSILKNNLEKTIEGYDLEDALPWDFIENYPPKKLLINEYNRLLKRAI